MLNVRAWLVALAGIAFVAPLAGCVSRAPSERSDADQVRDIERVRLRALVDADLDVARGLHAEDFQLITPTGTPLSKDAYLDAVKAGQPRYVAWEPGEILVKVRGDLAVIRYRDVRFDVDFGGRPVHRGPMVHTNVYERRAGAWQIVWSQASGVVKVD